MRRKVRLPDGLTEIAIEIRAERGGDLAAVAVVLYDSFPTSTFTAARPMRGGWRMSGVVRSGPSDDGETTKPPVQTAEPSAEQAESTDVVIAPLTDGPRSISYPFAAAIPDREKLRRERERLLADPQREGWSTRLPSWCITFIREYVHRSRRGVSGQDVAAEAMALFVATHELPLSTEER